MKSKYINCSSLNGKSRAPEDILIRFIKFKKLLTFEEQRDFSKYLAHRFSLLVFYAVLLFDFTQFSCINPPIWKGPLQIYRIQELFQISSLNYMLINVSMGEYFTCISLIFVYIRILYRR